MTRSHILVALTVNLVERIVCCLVSNVPLAVKIAEAKEVEDGSSSTEISNNLNSLSPTLNLFVSEDGIKNEPSTFPAASVVKVDAVLG